MRSKIDLKLDRRTKQKKRKSPQGGKALQRLFTYLGARNPILNDDVVATFAVPKSARPQFGLTQKALRAKPTSAAKVARAARTTSTARSFAAAIATAAASLATRSRRARTTTRRARAAVAVPPAAAPIWQAIGPSLIPKGQTYGTNRVDVSGRVSSIAVDPNNPKHLLLGSAGGGIWESTGTGATWQPRTDQMPSLAIGAIAFDPTNPARVYAGSGEGNFYANLGAGVYKSTNGGATWTVSASAPFIGVGFFDLVVDRQNPAVLYAATTNGFYKSTNSGASWSLKRAGRCWDISLHPNGGMVELLASFVDGLFVSTNAGNSFTAVTLPSGPTSGWTRLAVDRVTAAPDVAYVFGAAGTGAHLWRRTGTTWTKITSLPALNISQAWYDWYVAAPPDNSGQVYLGAIDTTRGDLTGSTWKWTNVTTHGANSVHPDQHCLTFSPGNSKIIYAGNDGGIFRSTDSGATWTALNKGLGITEIEFLASDPNTWKWLMAGTQDNGTIRYTGSTVWEHIADGDGGDCGVNQLNPNVVYHSYYGVSLERSTNKGNTWTSLSPPSIASLFYPPVEVFGSTVAIGAVSLVVTRSGGPPWTTFSLGLPTGEVTSAMREIDANTILIGTNKGRVLRMSWTGASWSKTQLTSPAPRYISCIAVDPSNPQRFWVTISQVGGGLVYRSDNAGSSWVNRTAGLPNIPMNSVVVDPGNFKRLWVAADVGVYQTLNLGSSWAGFSNGLPNAMAADLVFHKQDRTLICATRNRGAWVMPVA
ncbi:MAG TPA: hypothetical protein VGW77_20085 [Candidatus Binatia bacterium]|jgi:hypothetical protein|nr:hypothetical protein [Candidatus Binatia bacterium]